MSIGNNIKLYRQKKGLTQKDLADTLHVTSQAVSRWENDDVEPSLDTLMKLTDILACTLDELFGKTAAQDAPAEEVPKSASAEFAKPILSLCTRCNEPIYEKENIRRDKNSKIFCPDCDRALREAAEEKRKEEAERRLNEKKDRYLKYRRRSYVLSALIALIPLGIAFYLKSNEAASWWYLLVAMLPTYTFFACLFLNNNFIFDMWCCVASWGCVKWPGLIFTFDLDGIRWLIGMKLLFAVLGFLIGAAAVVLATVICAAMSIFVYPFALVNNYKLKDSDYE